MMLIIFMGIMVNSALASGGCNVGNSTLNNFDWNKFADGRPWFFLLHESSDFQNNLDCPTGTFASPEGNVSKVTTFAYDKAAQRPLVRAGTVTNWDNTGYCEIDHDFPSWTGIYRVVAVDYDLYFITMYCPYDSKEMTVYVAFRSSRPDIETVVEMAKKLPENNIDITHLLTSTTNHCQ